MFREEKGVSWSQQDNHLEMPQILPTEFWHEEWSAGPACRDDPRWAVLQVIKPAD